MNQSAIRNPQSAILIALVCVLAGSASAQSTDATITGRIVDPTNAVIVGARVDVINVQTNIRRSVETNEEGIYVVPNLKPGIYRIEVSRVGFKTVIKPDVILHVQDVIAINFTLPAGSIAESITVTASAPLVNTESGAVGTVVDRQFVGNIPLNGRTVQSLIALAPGVVLTPASALSLGQFSVNGQRADTNYFTVDGVSANIGHSQLMGQIGFSGGSTPGLTATGGTNNLVSVDAMQEFRIQTSGFASEYGRSPGGQIAIVTRSGTNEFHGTLFEYLRNDALDANDWFANQQGFPKAALRQNNFGGVLGGPIWRDHTFFFFSYEGQRLRLPNTTITSVPSLDTRQNAPAAAQPYFNAFPIPNGPVLTGGLAQFSGTYSDRSNLDATSVRVDHTPNNKLTLFGRYNHSPSDFVARTPNGPQRLSPSEYTTVTVTAGATALITTRLTNEFRFNWSRNKINSFQTADNYGGAVPLDLSSVLPSFMNPSESQFQLSLQATSYTAGMITRHRQRQLNILNNLTWLRGTHQMKFGMDYRRMFPTYNPARHSLNYFTNIPAVLAGNPASTLLTFSEGPFNPVFLNLSLFAQDSWRATPRLVLTYGLRWDFNPAPEEADGKDPFTATNLDDPANITLVPQGTRLYRSKYTNFAPRIGASYALFQSRNWPTALRGGFGSFYDLGSGDAGGGFSGYPFRATSFTQTPMPANLSTLSQPQLPANPLTPPFISAFVLAFDPDLDLPRTYQWNLAVEQGLGASQSVSLTYVGAAGRRLLRQYTIFAPNANFPFPSSVTIISNTGSSNYHALQIQFQRRLSAGLQGLASYTWGHSLDNASDNVNSAADPRMLDPDADYASSDFDVRHSFSAAFTYNLPAPHIGRVGVLLRDWTLLGIFHARTATPVNVVTGQQDLFNFGFFALRPNVVPGQPFYINDDSPGGRRINPAAFVTPTSEQGNLPRNALRGFGAHQLDFGVQRLFKLTERLNLQFRSELFNIFNHPNFGNPRSALTDPLFGISTQMLGRSLGSGRGGGLTPLYQIGGPRSVQFALRLEF